MYVAGSERDKVIGQNVVTLRGETSQQALAGAMRSRGHRWSQSTVWSVEKGERPLKLDEAIELAKILACPIEKLWREPEIVETDRVLHRRWLNVDELFDYLQDAAVEYEHSAEVLRNLIAYADERGIEHSFAHVFEDGQLTKSAAEAVAPERLVDAWLRVSGRDGYTLPDYVAQSLDRKQLEAVGVPEPADPDAASQVADFLGDFGISMTAVPVEGEAVEGDGEHQETA